jgi:hypothetical protein
MSHTSLYIHPPRSACHFNTENAPILDEKNPKFHEIASWKAGESLISWWNRFNPIDFSNDNTDPLVDLIEQLDKAEDTKAYRNTLFLLLKSTSQWLLKSENGASMRYQLVLSLRENVKSRYQFICDEQVNKAKKAIHYANINIERYKHDADSLAEKIALLPASISKKSRESMLNRLEKLKKPLVFFRHVKEENEKAMISLREIL